MCFEIVVIPMFRYREFVSNMAGEGDSLNVVNLAISLIVYTLMISLAGHINLASGQAL